MMKRIDNIHLLFIYLRPNPLALFIAMRSFSFNLLRDLYDGKSRLLKHVWAIGKLQLKNYICKDVDFDYYTYMSAFCGCGWGSLDILKCISAMPPIGMRSLPVAKSRRSFCCDNEKLCTTSQKCLQIIFYMQKNHNLHHSSLLNGDVCFTVTLVHCHSFKSSYVQIWASTY